MILIIILNVVIKVFLEVIGVKPFYLEKLICPTKPSIFHQFYSLIEPFVYLQETRGTFQTINLIQKTTLVFPNRSLKRSASTSFTTPLTLKIVPNLLNRSHWKKLKICHGTELLIKLLLNIYFFLEFIAKKMFRFLFTSIINGCMSSSVILGY